MKVNELYNSWDKYIKSSHTSWLCAAVFKVNKHCVSWHMPIQILLSHKLNKSGTSSPGECRNAAECNYSLNGSSSWLPSAWKKPIMMSESLM